MLGGLLEQRNRLRIVDVLLAAGTPVEKSGIAQNPRVAFTLTERDHMTLETLL
jgi:hypothetical protein